jgi:hypothetical protein
LLYERYNLDFPPSLARSAHIAHNSRQLISEAKRKHPTRHRILLQRATAGKIAPQPTAPQRTHQLARIANTVLCVCVCSMLTMSV